MTVQRQPVSRCVGPHTNTPNISRLSTKSWLIPICFLSAHDTSYKSLPAPTSGIALLLAYTHNTRPYLSALEIGHYKALYNVTFCTFSAHLTLLERTLAVDICLFCLSVRPSVKRVTERNNCLSVYQHRTIERCEMRTLCLR